jgi:prevent-host-death family protein
MRYLDSEEAERDMSKLLARVALGEEIVIVRGGMPVARLVPNSDRPARRVAGEDVGKVVITDDFDAPLPESLLLEFES